ncbi:MAG: hypothetical protein EA405_10500 [Rhodospirillales bacterium]|nr:MAG: hypothetical protein EA405_10500 [Rhodospirillales bacterium]
MTTASRAPEVRRALERFRAFYADLADVKAQIRAGAWRRDEEDAGPEAVVRPVFARLRRSLADLGYDRRRDRTEIDVGYVMAAVADEVMLHMVDWEGRRIWSSTLLEEAIYGSREAGDRVLDAGAAVAAGRQSDRKDLAAAILLALLLGFRGRCRGADHTGEIADLKARLYALVFGRPFDPTVDWQTIMSGAVGPTLDAGRLRRLPRLAPWVMAIAATVVLYLAVSHVIWWSATSSLLATSDRIAAGDATRVERDR